MSASPARTLNTQLISSHPGNSPLLRTAATPVQRGSTILLPSARDLYNKSLKTYGRAGLATHEALCDMLGRLENAEGVTLYPSGLAAITGTLLALTSAGDEVLAVDCVYGPTRRFLNGTLRRFGVTTRYFSPAADAREIEALISERTRLIFLESPGSLTFEIQDIAAIAAIAKRRGVLTAIDNTWAAGVLFKPLDHGVDVSIQALTKYVCGHSDVFMGMAAAKGHAKSLLEAAHHDAGYTVSADDAASAIRGLRTLCTRMTRHGETAMAVAQWLQTQPWVLEVLCPALPGAPGHDLWRGQFGGINGLLGVVLQPQCEEHVLAMLDRLRLFGLGYSWGGFESLAIHADPQLQQRVCSGAFHGPQRRGPLIRLHVGLESAEDLIEDLREAFQAFQAFDAQAVGVDWAQEGEVA